MTHVSQYLGSKKIAWAGITCRGHSKNNPRRSWSSIARGFSHQIIIDYISGWLGDPSTTTLDFLPLPRKGFAVHIYGIGLGFGSEASDQSAARSLEGLTFYARRSCSRTTAYASH